MEDGKELENAFERIHSELIYAFRPTKTAISVLRAVVKIFTYFLEIQIPKKVKSKVLQKPISETQVIKFYSGQCPMCNAPVTTHYHINNCGNCGQRLTWE